MKVQFYYRRVHNNLEQSCHHFFDAEFDLPDNVSFISFKEACSEFVGLITNKKDFAVVKTNNKIMIYKNLTF